MLELDDNVDMLAVWPDGQKLDKSEVGLTVVMPQFSAESTGMSMI